MDMENTQRKLTTKSKVIVDSDEDVINTEDFNWITYLVEDPDQIETGKFKVVLEKTTNSDGSTTLVYMMPDDLPRLGTYLK